jgi:hypothetical protein
MEKRYAQQMIEWSKTAKETLTVRKEIIIDTEVTDDQLGKIIRQMYKAKVDSENAQIERCKQYL